jgi:hypothetical protein
MANEGGQHIQSLIAGAVLIFLGAQTLVVGLLATAISWNRKLLEEVLYRLKDAQVVEAVAEEEHVERIEPVIEKLERKSKVA